MLAEMVIAAAITLMLLGATFSLVDPTRGALSVQPVMADMHQRMRSAFERVHADLLMAGSGPNPTTNVSVGSLRAPVVPALIGHRHSATAGTTFASDAISLLYAPPQDAGATLASRLDRSATTVQLSRGPAGCAAAEPACELEADSLALVFDEHGRSDIFRVEEVSGGSVRLTRVGGGAAQSFSAGASIVPLEIRSYYFDDTSAQLRYQDGWLTDVPVLDNVVGLSFRYFGGPLIVARNHPVAQCLAAQSATNISEMADPVPEEELAAAVLTDGPWCGGRLLYDVDLFRIRRVRVEIRLQVASEQFRGNDRTLFARPGSAVRGGRSVPDLVASFEVTPRNTPGR